MSEGLSSITESEEGNKVPEQTSAQPEVHQDDEPKQPFVDDVKEGIPQAQQLPAQVHVIPQGYGQSEVYAQSPPLGPENPQGVPGPAPQGYVQSQGIAPFPAPPGSQQQPVGAPQQQQPIQWMPPPEAIASCPPGLEYLTLIDQILVHQQVELWEVVTAYQTANRYIVKNTLGQQIYFAAEESNLCCRQYCGINRPFELSILDNSQKEVIHMVREFACSTHCYCFWIKQRLEVQSPPGQVIGYVRQDCSFWNPRFTCMNAEEQEILTISGSMLALCCLQYAPEIKFEVASLDGTVVGSVIKQWSGLAKELFTSADNFGISFPMDLDVRMKAVMIGACFLIDYIFFENQPRARRRR
ncbi:Phospholipid scramblase 2-like [Oopsacas minuta]|uniref:Phospholipid scramblase n=1 Tax=Oopsacas minuta TaxID=111878 RepID=A0AAV7JL77_9METZ|nr:Phospholipid scramblase 2-like [Oopsacas minuta]